jgi:hypothetical protein
MALAALLLGAFSTAFGQTNLIVNGGFESPDQGEWVISGSGAEIASNTNLAYSGAGYLSMGNMSAVSQYAYQTVTVPSNAVAMTLQFFYNISVPAQDASGSDTVTVYIKNATTGVSIEVAQINNSASDTNYLEENYEVTNLATWAGQQVEVFFYALTDNYGSMTSFSFDNVSLWVETTADIPSNDFFTNRTALTGSLPIIEVANNTFATKEPGEPNHAGNVGGNSLWWSWTPLTNGIASINTYGSSFYTLLAVYTGSDVSDLTRVASDSAVTDSSGYSQVKFNAIAGTEYNIAVDGYNGGSGAQYGTIVLNLSFQDDTKSPSLSISSPSSEAKLTNSTVQLKGTAKDAFGLVSVQYRLENADGTNNWQTAQGTTNWSATITGLTPGTNTLQVQALDTSSNVTTVTRSFQYIVVSPFALDISGTGTVGPELTGQLLDVGKAYALTAKPGAGFVFSNWTDSDGTQLSTLSKWSFTMESNLVLDANFVPNPFIPVIGKYAGLCMDTNNPAFDSSGYFTATLMAPGSFSAKLQLGGPTYSISGTFSAGGFYSNSIARKGLSPLSVQLQLDLASGQVITGLVQSDAWSANLTAPRACYPPANPAPSSITNRHFTLVIQAADSASGQPGGYGWGTLSVDAAGNLKFTGALGDGTSVQQTTFVSKDGLWPLFLSDYSNKGALLGWLAFTNTPEADLSGAVTWFKPPLSGKLYPQGFTVTNSLQAVGSLYAATKDVPPLSLTNLTVVLQGADLPTNIDTSFSLGANGKVTPVADKSSLSMTLSSGLFRGSILNPPGKPIAISGVLFQKQTNLFGWFAGTNATGTVSLGDTLDGP